MDNSQIIATLIVYALLAVALWKIFEKAGEKGWKAVVPFYNLYILSKLTWGNGWWFLLALVPLANLFFEIFTMIKLGQAFKKSSGFVVGLVLLPVIFALILGFSDATYEGIPENMIIRDDKEEVKSNGKDVE